MNILLKVIPEGSLILFYVSDSSIADNRKAIKHSLWVNNFIQSNTKMQWNPDDIS
jgi:hypothetical protein